MTVINNSLKIHHHFSVPKELIYEAWTNRDHADKWGPSGLKMHLDSADFRVGGGFQITMEGEHGKFVNSGKYKEILPNEKLVFTHGWEGPDRVDTNVTLEFRDDIDGSELVLTQKGFRNHEAGLKHEEGWKSALDNLEKYLVQLHPPTQENHASF